jgi:glycosyltransferase involved in cell wall biosynthesis
MRTVCFVNGTFPPYLRGGAENYIIEVAHELKSRGYKVCVLTSKPLKDIDSVDIGQEIIENIPVYRFAPINIASRSTFPEKSTPIQTLWRLCDLLNPYSARKVERVLEYLQPDIIHSNNLMGVSTISTIPMSRCNAKHVHTLHDYSLLCPTGSPRTEVNHPSVNNITNSEGVIQAFSMVQKRLMNSPDVVTAPSQHIIDVHRKYGLFEGIPNECIPLGVKRATKLERDHNSKEVLYVGRITERKGLDTLFRAADIDKGFQYHICGTGPYEDVVRKKSQERENVEYHGYVSEDELLGLRKRATVGLVPSLWQENSPMTIYESFAHGLPIVASDIGGIPELVDHGKTGRLFSPGDPRSLVRELKAAADEGENKRLSQNAFEWADSHTIESHVDEIIRLYSQ